MRVFKEFRFEAAHSLPHLPSGHKCNRLHGHSYVVRVTCEGPVDPKTGFVVDYARISALWTSECFSLLDHQFINDVPGLSVSTSERLAEWVWARMSTLPLAEVEVRETPTAGAVYRGQ